MPVVQIGYGEYFDRLTILVNKIYNCKDPGDVTYAMSQLINLTQGFSPPSGGEVDSFRENLAWLRDINKTLWNLEASVRVEKDPANRTNMSDLIREFNGKRSEAKCGIEIALNQIPGEVKDYKENK